MSSAIPIFKTNKTKLALLERISMKINLLLSSASLAITLSILSVAENSHASDMVYSASKASSSSHFLQFTDILKSDIPEDATLQHFYDHYNPTRTLNDIRVELHALQESKVTGKSMKDSLKNLFLKWVFTHHLHFILTLDALLDKETLEGAYSNTTIALFEDLYTASNLDAGKKTEQ